MSYNVSLILAQKIAFSWDSTSSRVLKDEVARDSIDHRSLRYLINMNFLVL